MKQKLIDQVVRSGSARTNRFEYRFEGDKIIKRRIDGKDATVWTVAKGNIQKE